MVFNLIRKKSHSFRWGLILVVKYRQKVFTDAKIIEKLKEILRDISDDFDVEVVNQECGEDHIPFSFRQSQPWICLNT